MFSLRQSRSCPDQIASPTQRELGQSAASRFAADRRGNIAMMAAILIVPMVGLVGASVDYAKALQMRSRMQSALDAAVLAAGREFQVSQDISKATARAAAYFLEQTSGLPVTLATNSVDPNTLTLRLGAQGAAQTPFLHLVGYQSLSVEAGAEAKLAVGGNGQMSFEISMMLDVTGSMSGSKIDSLKLAAKDLVDIVVWDDQSQYTSRLALVPFSESVRVGSPIGSQITVAGGSRYDFIDRSGRGRRYYHAVDCVTERTGPQKFTDAAPAGTDKVGRMYSASGACGPSNQIMPLTSDKTAIKGLIDSFVATGTTAGHLGTAWAWYMLSPNWASVLPQSSQPVAYGTPQVKKIAILMTDGEYNTEYCNGVNDGTINCNAPNGSSTSQARALCTNMKAAGITVYAVGFQVGGSARDTLRDYCATDTTYYYDAADGEALRQAFRDIALKIAQLRLSK
ncbi:MAG: pilus assembly protein [Hyphomicrobiaceae bacterium]